MSSTDWAESIDWNTRPPIDGDQLAAFGEVSPENYYEVDLGPGAVNADGLVSYGLDSTSRDGSTWGTRSYSKPPQLLIDIDNSP